jgi:hypothetical protein
MNGRRFFGMALIVAGVFAAGCAAPQSRELQQTLETYSAAAKDPTLTQRARVTLYEAGQALDRARKADSREEQKHWTYLARQKIELSQIQARQLQSQQEMERLQEKQDQALMTLRRRQNEQARRQAEQAQEELQAYQAEIRQRELDRIE